MTPLQGVTIDTIGGGALTELFAVELARILANIADPNTDISAKRSMKIEITFKPNRDRDVVDTEISCGSKLAGIMTVSTQLYMGRHQGKLVAIESDPRQAQLFDDRRSPLSAVAPFRTGE